MSEYKQISDQELQQLLAEHAKWLNGADTGRQAQLEGFALSKRDLTGVNLMQARLGAANLSYAKLDGANLAYTDCKPHQVEQGLELNTNLAGASLRGANLTDAELERADMSGTDLAGARLSRARLEGATLTGAILFNADLTAANLSHVVGLAASALAGSVLIDAKLPETVTKFDGLERVAEISKNASLAFVGMLAACGYSWLTIATTSDPRLVTNSSTSPLPIASTEIPIGAFYWVAPLVVVGAYLYFHLYLQRLWHALSKLPAVFPDGLTLDEKAYPWLLTGLVRAYFAHLKSDRPLVSRAENLLTVLLAWWLVPLTLVGFWVRYLPRHDWLGTALHIVLITTAIWAGMAFFSLMQSTLLGHELKPLTAVEIAVEMKWRPVRRYLRSRHDAVTLLACLGIILFSIGAIEGRPAKAPHLSAVERNISTAVSDLFQLLGFRTYAQLKGADISVKPPNWTGLNIEGWEKEYSQVKGASMPGVNLRYARADDTFLIKAELDKADFTGSSFAGADFRNASLSETALQLANLRSANLQGAVLRGAKLNNADLSGALFDRYSDLAQADFSGANLGGVELSSVDLTKAVGLTAEQIDAACFRGEQPKLPSPIAATKLHPCPDTTPKPSRTLGRREGATFIRRTQ